MKLFPKCSTVFGIIVINEKTDLTLTQLKNAFKNMKSLAGGVRIQNSKFQNLSFLSTLENLMCEVYGIYVMKNPYLTDISVFAQMNIYGDDFGNECDFRVENNAELNAEGLCDQGNLKNLMDIKVEGNFKDCGCQGDQISDFSLETYKNCATLFRGFRPFVFNVSENSDALSHIELIRGGIDIRYSPFTDLSFLENLETIKIHNEVVQNKLFLNLQDNMFLERLAIPNLREILNMDPHGANFGNIQGNHKSFCLTVEEILFFLENQISFLNIRTRICPDNKQIINGLRICVVFSRFIIDLPDDCNVVVGDVANIITHGRPSVIIQDNNPNIFKTGKCDLFGIPDKSHTLQVDYLGGDCGMKIDQIFYRTSHIPLSSGYERKLAILCLPALLIFHEI
ncbi:hypothetical protein B9Z55_017754 [Caenorhabditis nigoni]|uniref:Receptor L-domain domain-containing protein n=1 Tax=Caenorhabditis nigoni TaxID=1611254 RepID=A0A2G5TAW2_9PELO|nr:hypothetical protein B9Z55_017754 [Caenorhabditis nigoni]